MNGRLTGDGRMTFPMKGDPPVLNLEGWHVDPDDPYQWIQDYKTCKYRKCGVGIKCPNSGKIREGDYCELIQLRINPAVCSGCTKREE